LKCIQTKKLHCLSMTYGTNYFKIGDHWADVECEKERKQMESLTVISLIRQFLTLKYRLHQFAKSLCLSVTYGTNYLKS